MATLGMVGMVDMLMGILSAMVGIEGSNVRAAK